MSDSHSVVVSYPSNRQDTSAPIEHSRTKYNTLRAQDFGGLDGCYQCKICLKNFQYFNYLKSHWAVAHKKNCDHCKKYYVDYENGGDREKSKKCNICEKIFDTFLKFRLHLERSHVVKYKCNYCKVMPRNKWSYQD